MGLREVIGGQRGNGIHLTLELPLKYGGSKFGVQFPNPVYWCVAFEHSGSILVTILSQESGLSQGPPHLARTLEALGRTHLNPGTEGLKMLQSKGEILPPYLRPLLCKIQTKRLHVNTTKLTAIGN